MRENGMTKYRSAASLLASGVATITLDAKMRRPKTTSTANALRADQRALLGDARRVRNQIAHGVYAK
jgi:hypothetical protein